MTVDHDQLVAYALGLLDDRQARDVEALLQRDERARRTVAELQDTLTDMVMDQDPVQVPAGDLDRLLDRVRAEQTTVPAVSEPEVREAPPERTSARPRRLSWLPWVAAAAVVAGLLVLPAVPAWQEYLVQREARQYSALPGAVTKPLLNAEGQSVGLFVRLANGQAYVTLDREPQSGRVYQAWQIVDGQPRSLGVFPDRTFLTDRVVPEGSTFAVTVEPPGGSDQPTSAPIAVTPVG